MPTKLATQVTTTVTTEVKLQPHARKMIIQRCDEHARLHVQAKAIEARKKAIGKEVREVFKMEGELDALLDSTRVGEHSMKLVTGMTSKFDKLGFMKKHGLTEEDFAEFTTEVPKAEYVRFTHPGGGDD